MRGGRPSFRDRVRGLGAVAVLLALGTGLAYGVHGARHHRDASSRTRPVAATSLDPSHNGLDQAWTVQATQLTVPRIGIPAILRSLGPCQVDQIRGSTDLRSTPYGVMGLVAITPKHCDAGQVRMRGLVSGGRVVVTSTGSRGSQAYASGTDVAIGFQWTGSWCGPRISAVRVALPTGVTSHRLATVDLPLSGTPLRCLGQSTPSLLSAAATAEDGDPAMPTPRPWSALRVSMTLGRPESGLTEARLHIANVGRRTVPLVPCPAYHLEVESHSEANGLAFDPVESILPCPPTTRAIAPGTSMTLPLDFANADLGSAATGDITRVQIALGGLPLVSYTAPRASDGRIVGSFRVIGGPYPGINRPLSGELDAHRNTVDGPVVASAFTARGRFRVRVPPGRYVVTGKTDSVSGASCRSPSPVVVRARATARAAVSCQIR